MYILNGSGTEIVNSDYVERFCLVQKEDAALIVASYHTDRPPVTLARYADGAEARSALQSLLQELASGCRSAVEMPESTLHAVEPVRRDARTKRRGGS